MCAVFLLERTDRTTCSCIIRKAAIQMDPGGLSEHFGLSYGTALWLLVYREQLKGMEKEITMEQQALYLLKDLVLVKECDSLSELKEKLILGDVSWRLLKEKLSFSEEFVQIMLFGLATFYL